MRLSAWSVVLRTNWSLQVDGFPVSDSCIQSYPHLHVCLVHWCCCNGACVHVRCVMGCCVRARVFNAGFGGGSSDVALKLNRQRKDR